MSAKKSTAKGPTIKQIQHEGAPGHSVRKVLAGVSGQRHSASLTDQVTIRLDHKPAEKTQIDFTDGLFITDPVTGNQTLTQFFLGVATLQLVHFWGVRLRSEAFDLHRGATAHVCLLWRG
jgi:hypothetical protein